MDGGLYALKAVSKKFAMKWRGELVKREFDVMREVSHPNIIRLISAFSDKNNYYFVLEYCPGGTLYQLIRRMKKLPQKLAMFYFCELLQTMEYLHSRNIIFRDIKAENILVDERGHLKLTDFGLAKKIAARDELMNSFCGSPIYIAPETLKRESYGVKVDFYAMGVLLYEMLFGVPPYVEKNADLLKQLKISKDITLPSNLDERIKLCLRMSVHRVDCCYR